jgi:hypothetical protein
VPLPSVSASKSTRKLIDSFPAGSGTCPVITHHQNYQLQGAALSGPFLVYSIQPNEAGFQQILAGALPSEKAGQCIRTCRFGAASPLELGKMLARRLPRSRPSIRTLRSEYLRALRVAESSPCMVRLPGGLSGRHAVGRP